MNQEEMKKRTKNSDPIPESLRVLILEDSPTDAELVKRELTKAGIRFTSKWVEKKDAFLKELEDFAPDIVLSDYTMPQFNGMEALRVVRELYPSIPLIVVTGSINEETAVECMKAGAADYVLKESLKRLGPAVEGVLEKRQMKEEKERAEEALIESERKYRGLFNDALDMIHIVDESGRIIDANPAELKTLGYTRQEYIGKPLIETVHPEYLAITRKNLEKVLGGEIIDKYETALVTKDGEKVDVEVAVVPQIEEGNIVAVRAIMRNITERIKAEAEKKELESQFRQVQKMEALGTLAGGIAHDFNNILSVIIGYADLAMLKLPEGSLEIKHLTQVRKGAGRARDLVQQILTFTRQSEQEQKPVYVDLMVKEAIKMLRASMPTTIEIRQDIQTDLLIISDPTQIHQIMMNLCTNASHAMDEKGGRLEVILSKVNMDVVTARQFPDLAIGPYVKLTVTDTGNGMPPAVLERIFDPYFTTKPKGEGTGLGLSVVHGIVKSCGGAITVVSEPGEGTTFQVYLPHTEYRDAEEESAETEPPPTGHERILFIDDEEDLVDIGQQMLGRLGYEVVTRTSSIEALELFRAKPDHFDLVLTDMTMPGLTGDSLAKELMKIRPDIPIILCTGFSEKITEQKAKDMGIRAYAMKPFVMRNMAKTIRKVLDG